MAGTDPRVGADSFTGYEQAHIARVVGPGVAITLLATIGLLLAKPIELSWLASITAALPPAVHARHRARPAPAPAGRRTPSPGWCSGSSQYRGGRRVVFNPGGGP